MNKPKKQFLGCVAKHTPPEYKIVPYSGLRNSAYEKELNAGHTNRAAVLRPPPGMKIQHLPKGIREYVSRNPADFKDYLDEISAKTKYLSTMKCQPDKKERTRSKKRDSKDAIYSQTPLMQGTESGGEFCRLQRTQGMLLFENSATKKHIQCMFIEKEHLGFLWFEIILYKQRLIELFGSYVVTIHHKRQNTKIRGKKCELNEESDNLKGLFEKELASYNNKKQCMKMNNKRYEERLQDLIEEKEKDHLEPCRGPGDAATKNMENKDWDSPPEKKPDLLNMDGNDVTRAVTYWMTTCLQVRPQENEAGSDHNGRKVRFADANFENKNFRFGKAKNFCKPALTPWQKGSGDER
ncbi:hypothetical protein PROFUN_16646 [Planoprotostelium fungivorum]|uniref:Uncharacterized protein n=1 Tax=Planoprotostelium fungivorum TaxID=1890364 RepID=A0A2P6MPV6_9EUKA|nr:hypothetical protein PROFUN_16646 [Planoprotostelium fungivorum]